MTWSCDRRGRGFTLLEVLVALAIAGMALAVMSNAATGGFLSARTAAGYMEAVSRAKSHLAALSSDSGFTLGQSEGDDGGGYHWRLAVSEEAQSDGPASPVAPNKLALYSIEVGVSWTEDGRRREVVLHSLRLGRAAVRRNG